MLRTRPVAAGEHFHVHCKPLPAGSGVLLMAVPKRLLARAVDRNLVRRLAREAWRGAGLHRQPLAAMVKLARRPACLARSRVTAAAARRGAASTRAAGKATLAGAGRRSNKKQLRAELDQLLATVCRRLGGSRP
ncbi:MAG: ribonuclease P protein component [Burkholderiales bacterium]|nr:ribonuclease P protein component [Burkholderiales bacterium]